MSQPPEPDTPGTPELPEQSHDGLSLDRDEFSQRLASFGLGEAPDLLLAPAPQPPRPGRKPR